MKKIQPFINKINVWVINEKQFSDSLTNPNIEYGDCHQWTINYLEKPNPYIRWSSVN